MSYFPILNDCPRNGMTIKAHHPLRIKMQMAQTEYKDSSFLRATLMFQSESIDHELIAFDEYRLIMNVLRKRIEF